MAVIYALLRVRLNNVQNVFVHQKINHRRNRHYFSANGPFLLLPLALKWGLLSLLAMVLVPCIGAKGAYAASLTVEVPQNPLSVTVSADGATKESSPANVKVTSDAYWGYTFSVKSNSDDGSLANGTNKLKTTTNNVANLDNNSWGFKFGKDTVSGNYHKSPTTTTATQIDKTAGQTGEKEENSYAFTLGAKVDNTQAAGIYTGQFTFTLTANAVDYAINYNGNGGSGEPATATGKSIEQTVQLSSSTPTYGDKTFIGWCSQEPTDKGGCKGEVYYPNDNYTLSSTGNNLTLYALWDGLDMQNWEGCETLRMSTTKREYQITLVDSRDKKPYYVAKLADNNCWMTENLDFDIEEKTYTALNTDLGYGDDGEDTIWVPTKEKDELTLASGTSSWKNSYYLPQSYDPGNKCWKAIETHPNGNFFDTDFRDCKQHDESHFYLGNYYDWSAAVAQSDTSDHINGGDVYNTSICPAGWQLPVFSGDKSFQALHDAVAADPESVDWKAGTIIVDENGVNTGTSTMHLPPYYFVYGGIWFGKPEYAGFKGHYTTNTAFSSISVRMLSFNGGGGLILEANGNRKDGFLVRCVARQ